MASCLSKASVIEYRPLLDGQTAIAKRDQDYLASSASSVLASCKSVVSKPSVNQA